MSVVSTQSISPDAADGSHPCLQDLEDASAADIYDYNAVSLANL